MVVLNNRDMRLAYTGDPLIRAIGSISKSIKPAGNDEYKVFNQPFRPIFDCAVIGTISGRGIFVM